MDFLVMQPTAVTSPRVMQSVEGGVCMNQMQLPSRVVDVLAALKTQGYRLDFSTMADGDICVEVYQGKTYRISFFLRQSLGFDMSNSQYETMCNVVDPRVQKKGAAVLRYLEGLIEY